MATGSVFALARSLAHAEDPRLQITRSGFNPTVFLLITAR